VLGWVIFAGMKFKTLKYAIGFYKLVKARKRGCLAVEFSQVAELG
jgi:hypothetical protein